MAWEEQSTKVPTSIGQVLIRLIAPSTYMYNVIVLDQNGDAMGAPIIGNLADIVSQGRINQAAGILDDVIAKAETDLLP